MARPQPETPPVKQSALAPANRQTSIEKYNSIAAAFERSDRLDDLRSMLGSEDAVKRFLSVALHAISSDSRLLRDATPLSIIQAVRDSATLGLEPTGLTGEAWIVVYGDQAKLMPGWRGYLKRVRNSGKMAGVDVQLIHENDTFDYGYRSDGGGWHDHHPYKPIKDPEGNWTDRGSYWGAYAYAIEPSGFENLEVMPWVDIDDVRRKYSKPNKDGKPTPWDTAWGEMARKTVLRKLCKRLPQAGTDALLALDAAADDAREEADEQAVRFAPTAARQAALRATGAVKVTVTEVPSDEAPEAATEAVAGTEAVTEDDVRPESDLSDLPEGWRER